jgi:DNA recombination protein RmuC
MHAMEFYLLIATFILLIVLVLLAVYVAFFKSAAEMSAEEKENLMKKNDDFVALKEGITYLQRQMQGELQHVRTTIDMRLNESAQDLLGRMDKQHATAVQMTKEFTEKISELRSTNQQVVGFAEQLRQLQDVLKNPKQRGVLGEYFLEAVLQNVFPNHKHAFQMQYAFSNGEIVDAVVFVKDKIIPIDSKFSLENYNRILAATDPAEKERVEKLFKQDLKLRIDETSKYVRPSENTTEFAFMFIPSEGLYYDILIGSVGTGISARDLIDYAFSKKVIIVSPTSFLAYLQTVLQGLKALHIEESAKQIRAQVEDLGRHIAKWEDYYKKLGNTLETTVNHYNAGYKEMGKIDKDVLKVTGSSVGVEIALLSKPELDN